MSDETIKSRLAELERENAELRKTSKADIDRRAEQLGMRCENCQTGVIYSAVYAMGGMKHIPCYRVAPPTNMFRMTVEKSSHYCREWEPRNAKP